MKPLVKSMKSGGKWERAGHNIDYKDNDIYVENKSGKCYRTLSFVYTFTHENDETQFAHCYPFTYTLLR
jgi:hypothetical protein